MTGKVVLLDTSVIIDAISGSLAAWPVIYRAGEVRMPAIAVGELFEGAEGSRQREFEIARVESFIARRIVLPCGTGTARQYGQIKHALRLKGRPIPTNDIWIAALAQQHELVVATRDAHFGEVDALPVLSW